MMVIRDAYLVLLSAVVELGGIQMNGSTREGERQKVFSYIRIKTTKSNMSMDLTDYFHNL